MSQRQSESAKHGLVFAGLEPGIIPWTLLGFILLSACVHAFGFFIFQTIYPPAAHSPPPPIQVSFIAPGTPQSDDILHWIESQDPALAARPGKAPIPGLTDLPYIPSYASVHARPSMVQTPEPPLPYPAGAAGLALVKMALPTPAATPSPPPPADTTIVFSGPLENSAIAPLPSMTDLREGIFEPSLQPARFLLGVSALGQVQYVFLQDSSGDKTLDADASRLLEQIHFKPATAWGFATFYWGPSAYATAK